MSWEKVCPLLMIVLSAGSALSYGFKGQWVHVMYWIGSMLLLTSVVLMKG